MNGFLFILYTIVCLQTDGSDSTFCQWGYKYTLNLTREHISRYWLNAQTFKSTNSDTNVTNSEQLQSQSRSVIFAQYTNQILIFSQRSLSFQSRTQFKASSIINIYGSFSNPSLQILQPSSIEMKISVSKPGKILLKKTIKLLIRYTMQIN